MNRRHFLKTLSGAATSLLLTNNSFAGLAAVDIYSGENADKNSVQNNAPLKDEEIKDYLHRMEDFDSPHSGDIILSDCKKALLKSSLARLKRVQHTIGFGNFYLLGFDQAIAFGRNYTSIGSFTNAEKEFLDEIFNTNAAEYGFFGNKPISKMTAHIPEKDVQKISGTGNYLYKGQPVKTYEAIKEHLGAEVMLTSGVRGVMKQFLLYMDKANSFDGNLSLASRSLAPPGYSFHGIGDFDVGQRNLGAANFSVKFTTTETCRRLQELGYLQLRYPLGNMLGVRFEPWHIKVNDVKV